MNREAYARLARLWATTLACINCGQMTKANSNAQALVDALRAAGVEVN